MPNGLGFNNYAAPYMSRVVNAGGTTPGILAQQAIEDLATACWISMSKAPVAVFPIYGGTADSHALNLFSSNFTLTYTGTITHSANGMAGNGVDGIARTSINPGINLALSDVCIGIYVRTNTAADVYDMGATVTANAIRIQARTVAGNFASRTGGVVNVDAAVAASTGLFLTERRDTDDAYSTRNGVQVGSASGAVSGLPNFSNIGICASSGIATFSSRSYAFVIIGTKIGTVAKHLALYTAVQAYQTTLGRQV